VSPKRVDILTTWGEAASALGMSWRTLKSLHRECLGGDLSMPIEVRGRRILTTVAQLQEWADRRAERARQDQNGQEK
jgi:hypothetical protein